MVLVFARRRDVRGSRRWIDLGVIQFQPSELGKVLFVLALAGFLVERAGRITRWRTVVGPRSRLGPDLARLPPARPRNRARVPPPCSPRCSSSADRWRQLAGARVAPCVVVAPRPCGCSRRAGVEVLKPYQTERVTGLLDPDPDPSGMTYNVDQSIMAVGAGGLTGRGVVDASQTRLDYLPEHATDFAFASLAEQRGFVGARSCSCCISSSSGVAFG